MSGIFDECKDCCGCNTTAKCRSIFLWRYLPSYYGFSNTGPNAPAGFFTSKYSPLDWWSGPLYETVTTVIGASSTGTSYRARSSNVATITPVYNPFAVGNSISVSGMDDSSYDTSASTITSMAPDFSTFSYSSIGSDEGTTADGDGTCLQLTTGTSISQWNYSGGYYPSQTGLVFFGIQVAGTTYNSATQITLSDGLSTVTVANSLDVYGELVKLTDPLNSSTGIGTLTGNLASLSWFDPSVDTYTGVGTYTNAWTFKDACVLPWGNDFCSIPVSSHGAYGNQGFDLTGHSFSSYDGSIVAVPASPAYGDNGTGLPDSAFGTVLGVLMGYPTQSSWAVMVGVDAFFYPQGPGCNWMGVCQSQVLFTGEYSFTTWLLYNDGSTVFESCVFGGTGDGVTPITIPIPNVFPAAYNGGVDMSIPASAYTSTNVFDPQPMGKMTCITPGPC